MSKSHLYLDRARKLIESGCNISEAANELGVSRRSLGKWLSEAGIALAPRGGWSDDKIERLKTLAADGYSAGQIATELGDFTRSSVMGKANRLGLSLKGGDGRPLNAPPVKRQPYQNAGLNFQRNRIEQKGGLSLKAVADANPSPHPPRVDLLGEPADIGVAIMQLGFGHCRWPLAMHQGERTFCGAGCEGSYCPEHRALAYQAPKPGQARTGNEMMRQLRRYAA